MKIDNKMDCQTETEPKTEDQYYHKVRNMLLESNAIVRKLFTSRWKNETKMDWAHNKKQAEVFINCPVGGKIYEEANQTQKEMLSESEGLIDWDLSLLALILYNFGDEEKYSKENGVVRGLLGVRNNMSHHPHKTIPIEEYKKYMGSIKQALINAISLSDVETMIRRAGITSSINAMEKVNHYLEKADKMKESLRYRDAICIYDEAIKVPSLLQINLAGLFEKRAECYLKICYDASEAYANIQRSLACYENSPTAHQIAAQCYRRQQDFRKAILSYEQSLILSPTQKSVKNELEGCKVLAGIPVRLDNPLPLQSYLILENQMKIYNATSSPQLSSKEYFEMKIKETQTTDQCQDYVYVILGHMNYNGLTQKDEVLLEKASRYFARAAKATNPEGTYNLGLCHQLGKGVPEDMDEAIGYYIKAAFADPDAAGAKTKTGKNLGVAIAQHTLASLYENGKISKIHSKKVDSGGDGDCDGDSDNENEKEKEKKKSDLEQAMEWYEKATINGFGHSANNLACIYYESRKTIPANEKKAAEYWQKGAELEDANSVLNLVPYFVRHLEPRRLNKLWETWKSMDLLGRDRQVIGDREFEESLMKPCMVERREYVDKVVAFEVKNKLTPHGTLRDRLNRLIKVEAADYRSVDGILKEMQLEANAERRKTATDTEECEQEYKQKKRTESVTSSSSTTSTVVSEASAERFKILSDHGKKFDETSMEQHDIFEGKLTQTLPKGMAGIMEITLDKMKPEDELIYEKRLLDLTLIDDLWMSPGGVIHSVAQDKNKEVIPVQLHSLGNPEASKHKFVFGSNISILNPYVQVVSGQRLLRNDVERCIMCLKKKSDICRYCGRKDGDESLDECAKCMLVDSDSSDKSGGKR